MSPENWRISSGRTYANAFSQPKFTGPQQWPGSALGREVEPGGAKINKAGHLGPVGKKENPALEFRNDKARMEVS